MNIRKIKQASSTILIFLFALFLIFPGLSYALSQQQMQAYNEGAVYVDTNTSGCAPQGQSTSSAPTTGSNVYILGDSITERAASTYKTVLGQDGFNVSIDAQAGRSLIAKGLDGNHTNGMQAIAQDKAEITAANIIIIALGTNGGDTPQTIDSAITAIRKDNSKAQIYWIDTIVINRPSYVPVIEQSNTAIYSQASSQNYSIISWFKKVDPNGTPTQLTGKETDSSGYIDLTDGLNVHPTIPKGVNALVKLVAGSITSGSSSSSSVGLSCCLNGISGGPTINNNKNQTQNIETIIGIAKTDGLGQNAALIGLMVADDESSFLNLANSNVPISENNPAKQGNGNNGTSLGVFQQQIIYNWSTISSSIIDKNAVYQLMDPAYAAEAFFGTPPNATGNISTALQKGLQNKPGWQAMQPWVAAQAVQGSGTSSGLNYKQFMGAASSLLHTYWSKSPPVALPVPFSTSGSNRGGGGNISCSNTSTLGYANPLRGISRLVSERVDQGVDFAGTGPVYAIGSGKVTNVYNSGWPGGTFINYKINSGSANGLYVYVAEYCTPSVSIGETVNSNTKLCNMTTSGIETGWGASNNGSSEAWVLGQATHGGTYTTGMGLNFYHFLKSLGYKGNDQINPPIQNQNMPSNYP